MDKRSCTMPGCSKPHRARGVCSTHYNQANVKLVELHCEACGGAVPRSSQRNRKRYRVACSMDCRAFLQFGPASCPVPDRHPSRSSPVRIDHPSRARRNLTPQFHAGYCMECGGGYVIASECVSVSRYCSATCARRTAKRARRAREHGATGTFTWDGFMKLALSLDNLCAYCGDDNAGHPLEPDHVVPLSRGGHNGLANILPACRSCNGQKHNLLPMEWDRRRRLQGHAPIGFDRFLHLTAHVFLAAHTA